MTSDDNRYQKLEGKQLTESEYRKLHGIYTSPSHPTAFDSVNNLVKASGLSRAKVLDYLQSSPTYTKLRATKRKFRRFPVIFLGINQI